MTTTIFEPLTVPSIRQRLMRALLGASVIWVLVVSAMVWSVIQHQVDELADAGLQESGELLYGLMATLNQPLPRGLSGNMLPAPAHQEKVIWQRVAPDSTLLLRSHHAPENPFFIASTPGLSSANGDWRVFGLLLPDQQGMVYVADHLSERRRARADAAWAAVSVTLFIGLVFVVALRKLVDRELAPLLTLSQAVSAYDPTLPDSSLPGVERQELAPIRKAVKHLGLRLTRRLENERAFSSHAAHALRTPLAGMDAQLAMALRECTPDIRPRLTLAREATNRLKRVVSTLLTLFRSGIDTRWQPLNMATLLHHVSIERLEISLVQPADVQADPDLLTAALISLLDNVVRHGGQHVRVQVQTDTRFQTISLHDDGPGVPVDHLHDLQRALAGQDYAGHMGLGLMMADIVARAHGGYLHIRNADSGLGMTAELTLRHPPKT